MHVRVGGVVLATLLLLAPAATAGATAPGAAEATAELAVEEPEGPPPGPEPQMEENPFVPGSGDYEAPWTYGLGVLLTLVAIVAILGTAVGYWLLVERDEESTRR